MVEGKIIEEAILFSLPPLRVLCVLCAEKN